MASFNSLNVPPKAIEHGGNELMRLAVANEQLYMSLRRGFDDPESWGRALAEVVKQVSQIYATETKYNKETAAKRILEAFAEDIAASGPNAAVIKG